MVDSPFPGMDPYLEQRERWSGVHTRLLTTIGDQLVELLAPKYVVGVEERVYLSDPSDPGYPLRFPDLYVAARPASRREPVREHSAITTPVHLDLEQEEIRDRFLVIRDSAQEEIVTAIELLSPTNKVAGSRGSEALQSKRDQFRTGGANWIEIDLLRGGDRNPIVAGRSSYCIVLYRTDRPGIDVWFVHLRDQLPRIAVPLQKPDPDTPLDLQQAFDTTYRRGGYSYSTHYDRAVPPPPLSPTDQVWADERLAAWRKERAGE